MTDAVSSSAMEISLEIMPTIETGIAYAVTRSTLVENS